MKTIASPSKDERQMLEFAHLWYRYGGGDPEDIMVTFGVGSRVFYGRVKRLLTQYPQCFGEFVSAAMADVAQERAATPQEVRGELPD